MAVVVLLSKSYLLFYTVLSIGPFFLFLLKRPIKWLKSKHLPMVYGFVCTIGQDFFDKKKSTTLTCFHQWGSFFSNWKVPNENLWQQKFSSPFTYLLQIQNCKNTITSHYCKSNFSTINNCTKQLAAPGSFHKKQHEQ